MRLSGASGVELSDIQGLVQRGYKELPAAEYVLLQVTDVPRARAWLSKLADRIEPATAAGQDKPDRVSALHLALTYQGLQALDVSKEILDEFPLAFREGMATVHRERLLGDRGASSAANWRWGSALCRPNGDEEQRCETDPTLHLILFVYAKDDLILSQTRQSVVGGTEMLGLREIKRLDTVFLAGPERTSEGNPNGPKEHFGFRDGIAQPHIAGMPARDDNHASPGNTIPTGEILLGYANAYGEIPEGPTDANGQGFGRNGTFLVFRQLHQDVTGFWTYVTQQAATKGCAPVELAAKMVGRWPDGTPLVESPTGPQPNMQTHDRFVYARHQPNPDPFGFHCPIGSHIRRTNPRDSLNDDPQKSVALSNQHRIVRRGRSYGKPLVPDMDPAKLVDAADDGIERGLHFICLNAAIDRQFEFVQNLWANNPKFGGLYDDPDPLIGVLDGEKSTFTVQKEPARCTYSDMPRFVQVRGGAYFFLPGIAAIRMLGSMK
ncbi:MAG: Dyp-type peroxidase [Nitrospira sp.]